jgi:glutathione S-transferase
MVASLFNGATAMRLYHHPISSNARRVRMTIHLNLPIELATLSLMEDKDRRQLATLNPNHKLPVLSDGDFVLWESCAIMQYLAEQVPGQTLYPQAPQARANVNRWMFWGSQHFGPAVSVLAWENVWKGKSGAGAADPVEVARGSRELARYAAVLDAHLAGRDWLAGDAVTLADFTLAAPLMYRDKAQLPLAPYTHIDAWFGRVQQLPAWRETNIVL